MMKRFANYFTKEVDKSHFSENFAYLCIRIIAYIINM